LRHALIRQGGAEGVADEAGRVLRRKPDKAALTLLETALREALESTASIVDEAETEPVSPAPSTDQMSASDGENERHIQDSIKPYFDSEQQ
ncbi:MAG TPA: replication initiator RepC, partial [Sulfitobacter sp.]|nr:replication initiator RepC [Sulfitobacter sp.]